MKLFKRFVGVLGAFLGHMGAYFMIVVLGLSVLGGEGRSFSPDYFGVAALFAAMLAISDGILHFDLIQSIAARSAIHVVLATVSFTVAFVLVSKVLSGGTGFVAAMCFFVIDIIAMCVRGAYINAVKRSERKESAELLDRNTDI